MSKATKSSQCYLYLLDLVFSVLSRMVRNDTRVQFDRHWVIVSFTFCRCDIEKLDTNTDTFRPNVTPQMDDHFVKNQSELIR